MQKTNLRSKMKAKCIIEDKIQYILNNKLVIICNPVSKSINSN
jgi:hypothetical protein